MSFWTRIEKVAERHNVLRHPFYVRWSEGTLTTEELAHYSGQYRHAVLALADAAAAAADSPAAGLDAAELEQHAAEEAAHVQMWDEFVGAVGGDVGAAPAPETAACVRAWAGDGSRSLGETLAVMYAIESAQPAIAATKQDGLERHYGISATSYFAEHRHRDVEHAAQMRELIAARLDGEDQDALVESAERALVGNWRLLDGVELACAQGRD